MSTQQSGGAERSILSSSAVMAAGTIVSRLSGFVRSALLVAADWFGQRSLNLFDPRDASAATVGARGARFPDADRGGSIVYENAVYSANLFLVDPAGQLAYQNWNKARRGWTTTESGLQYRRVGKAKPNAPQPAETDTVSVHYRGTFIDGREFDSSYSRNEPASFPLNRVIKGWTEGVALMRTGETYEFVIPADLAYGARWMGTEIPANSALRFTVELLEVNPS